MTTITYTLGNGLRIPAVGLGTWLIPNEQAAGIVDSAIKAGYRHIDTAQAYENEEGVGDGVRRSGIPRDRIFITSKVAAEIKDHKLAAASIDESLRRLGMDYIDLMLIHCPQPWAVFRSREKRYFEENKQVWKALEEAYKAGKLKAIGVSNFLVEELEDLLPSCEIRPMVNQFELHIGETPQELLDYCKSKGILPEAYCPNAHGRLIDNPVVVEMAGKYGVSAARLCIRYTLQLGAVSLPKSLNPAHIASNIEQDFSISDADMDILRNVRL